MRTLICPQVGQMNNTATCYLIPDSLGFVFSFSLSVSISEEVRSYSLSFLKSLKLILWSLSKHDDHGSTENII